MRFLRFQAAKKAAVVLTGNQTTNNDSFHTKNMETKLTVAVGHFERKTNYLIKSIHYLAFHSAQVLHLSEMPDESGRKLRRSIAGALKLPPPLLAVEGTFF